MKQEYENKRRVSYPYTKTEVEQGEEGHLETFFHTTVSVMATSYNIPITTEDFEHTLPLPVPSKSARFKDLICFI